ncbi:tetratricopeptide repeat-containing diguanylate cyclase [Thalassotalea piscium]
MIKIVIPLVGIICFAFSLFCTANDSLDSTAFERAMFKDPYSTYQTLIQTPPKKDNKKIYLLWLMRKAQGENLLYFFDEFEQTINEALLYIDEGSPLLIKSQFNLFQGILYQNKGEYKKSSKYLTLALEEAKLDGDDSVYIQAKLENAYTQSLAEMFEVSLIDLQEVYIKAYELNDEFLLAAINETYGAIYGYLDDYEKSIEYYLKALKSYEKLGYKAHIAEAVYGLASTYRYWKRFDSAITNFERYREVATYTPNDEISFFAAYGLGMTLAEQGKCEQALVVIEQALLKKGVKDYKSELYKNKAICLINIGKVEQANQALYEAKLLFNELPDLIGTTWELETLKIESQIALAKGDYPVAYKLLDEYYQKYTSVLKKNSTDRLLKVRASMELERQSVEKSLTFQRNQVATLKEETLQQKHKQQQYFVLFLLLIIILIIGVMLIQRRSHNKMRLLSITDPLSGLYNRRYIFGYLDKTLAGMSADKGELSIILLDIDDFKDINDQYGHPFGDFVIQKIAEIGQDVLRTGDVMARIGGEEFLCVLPRASVEQAKEVAERLLKALALYSFQAKGYPNIHVTTSIGIACFSKEHQSYNEIYAQADKALYKAKERGKNCIVIA